MTFNKSKALDLWDHHKASILPTISDGVLKAIPAAQIVELVLKELMEALIKESPRAWAWMLQRVARASARLDERLTWNGVREGRFKDWLEDNDDLYTHLIGGLAALSEAVELEIDAETGAQILSLFDSPVKLGRALDFRAVERPQSTDLVTTDGVSKDDLIASLANEKAELASRVDSLTEEVSTLRALIQSGAADAVLTPAPKPVIPSEPVPTVTAPPAGGVTRRRAGTSRPVGSR